VVLSATVPLTVKGGPWGLNSSKVIVLPDCTVVKSSNRTAEQLVSIPGLKLSK
jgi:hypothetical protein